METTCSSETSAVTGLTLRHIPEDGILQVHHSLSSRETSEELLSKIKMSLSCVFSIYHYISV
jgi:hypothetical protein